MGDNISTCGGIISVLWGLHQYCGGYSVLWGDNSSTCGGITAVHVGDSFSTCRGIASVLWGDSFSTVGGSFSTVEVVQYSGG